MPPAPGQLHPSELTWSRFDLNGDGHEDGRVVRYNKAAILKNVKNPRDTYTRDAPRDLARLETVIDARHLSLVEREQIRERGVEPHAQHGARHARDERAELGVAEQAVLDRDLELRHGDAAAIRMPDTFAVGPARRHGVVTLLFGADAQRCALLAVPGIKSLGLLLQI